MNQILKALILVMLSMQFSAAQACAQHDVASFPSVDCGQASSVRSSNASEAIHSVADADLALRAVAEQRLRIAARFAEDERVCYERFFVTSCLDRAKEQRRTMLSNVKLLENEANLFKRRARVEERDKNLASQPQP